MAADPGPHRWREAVTASHRDWFSAMSDACGGSQGEIDGVPWAVSGCGARELQVFLDPDHPVEATIDRLLGLADEVGAGGIGVWAIDAAAARHAGPTLLGRGLSLGWQPRWMWHGTGASVYPSSRQGETTGAQNGAGVPGVEVVVEVPEAFPDELPYGTDLPPEAVARLTGARPDTARFLFAVEAGRVVGQAAVLLTGGPVPIAGLYSCGVVPEARNRGIATLLTATAVRVAADHGHPHLALNATPMGAPVYLGVGFVDLGYGRTWWRRSPVPPDRVVTDLTRRLTEAVARDDVGALDAVAPDVDGDPAVLCRPLPCGPTPFRLAGDLDAGAAAGWLHDRGAPVDVVAAWRLGWRDRLPAIMAATPAIVDELGGDFGATPLHEAAQAGDAELAALLLAAGADTSRRDRTFRMTAAGWARHFGHDALAATLDG